jgi:hypothetical protein
MGAVNCAEYKKIGSAFPNEVCMSKLTYNFANDGGATTSTYRLAKTEGKMMVTKAVVQVETACTATAGAVVTIGAEGVDVDCFMDATAGALANLADDYAVVQTAGQKVVIGSGDYITLYIATQALTAGKINLFLEWVKVA